MSLIGLAAGCSLTGQARPELAINPTAGDDGGFTAAFDAAYFRENGDGETDVLLVAAPGADPSADASTDAGPLRSDTARAVRQIVHFRILWTAKSGTRVDSPSSTNAAIDWYVLGPDGANIHYTGSAYVVASHSGDDAEFTLYGARIRKQTAAGDLSDPIRQATLAGTFDATRDGPKIDRYLGEAATQKNAAVGSAR